MNAAMKRLLNDPTFVIPVFASARSVAEDEPAAQGEQRIEKTSVRLNLSNELRNEPNRIHLEQRVGMQGRMRGTRERMRGGR
jgi:hypothetical protein